MVYFTGEGAIPPDKFITSFYYTIKALQDNHVVKQENTAAKIT